MRTMIALVTLSTATAIGCAGSADDAALANQKGTTRSAVSPPAGSVSMIDAGTLLPTRSSVDPEDFRLLPPEFERADGGAEPQSASSAVLDPGPIPANDPVKPPRPSPVEVR